MQGSKGSFTVIYLSETGVGQTIGERIHNEASSHGLKCDLFDAGDFVKVDWVKAPRVFVFIASSTGDGDPPQKAIKFWRWLRSPDRGDGVFLSGASFALLGLGDSNYSSYMNMPRLLQKRLLALGAQEILPRAEADDATPNGLESAVEPWLEKLWPALSTSLSSSSTSSSTSQSVVPSSSSSSLYPRLPDIAMKCISCPLPPSSSSSSSSFLPSSFSLSSLRSLRCLTRAGATKTVLLARLVTQDNNVGNTTFKCSPGDAVAIRCPNLSEDVTIVAKRILETTWQAIDSNNDAVEGWPAHVPRPVGVEEALTWHTDLGALPSKRLLRALAEHCSDEKEKHQMLQLCELSAEGKQRYQKLADERWGMRRLLEEFSSLKPPLALLLSLLPPLKPRYYSVCSIHGPGDIEIAFTLIREGSFRGACSHWIPRVAHASHLPPIQPPLPSDCLSFPPLFSQHSAPAFLSSNVIPVEYRPPTRFRLPEVLRVPVMMVGPGTGVAPFLAFLQHMKKVRQTDETTFPESHLYFGCRHRNHDFLFQEEMEQYVREGVLKGLHVALSREHPESKKYVQHLLDDHWSTVSDALINRGAYIYVCGDARNMAPDVHQALLNGFVKFGLTQEAAIKTLDDLKAQDRYCIDVWA